mmetsp:Transcript_1759/g.4317  ORF Transcript_1759/g.4317 Transcript_1759/m.4317 type:complete len:225 (+) Transcript_1759:6-680(+)
MYHRAASRRRPSFLPSRCPSPLSSFVAVAHPAPHTPIQNDSRRIDEAVPGGWPQGPHRGGREPRSLPHDHLRAERRDCQVEVLVLHAPVPQDEEDHRRDPGLRRAGGEEHEDREELRHLVALLVAIRHAQYVPRIPRRDAHRRRFAAVRRDGRPPPLSPAVHPDHPNSHRRRQGPQARQPNAIRPGQGQVPAPAPRHLRQARPKGADRPYLLHCASNHLLRIDS